MKNHCRFLLIISLLIITMVSCQKESLNNAIISTQVVTRITIDSAKSGGDILDADGESVTARGVVWSRSPGPTIKDNDGITTDGAGTGGFTSTLSGLSPQTRYYIRAYATTPSGNGYGQEKYFTTGGVTDIDGNFYPSVSMGEQMWMAENLRVTRDANGNAIERLCFDDHINNCLIYGGLYTWQTVMNGEGSNNSLPGKVQGICPTGWHIPSITEWNKLTAYVVEQGFTNQSPHNPGVGAGNALRSCRQESSPLAGECDTQEHPRWNMDQNQYGFDEFAALPAAQYMEDSEGYPWLGYYTHWWSSTNNNSTSQWAYGMEIVSPFSTIRRDTYNVDMGFSLRCVRD